ncbi:MAG: cold-shock protein [Corynebacterium sp.]|nr:cold-shock protein [Corynebacterium sp.]
MPSGKVRWYDASKGFGFIANPEGEDVYVSKQVLPRGITELHAGQRVEFDYASGRRGPQALRLAVLESAKPRARQHKYSPEQLSSMIADLTTVLEAQIQPALQRGRFPERKESRQVASILRAVAQELDS